jgi:hypothetical protein
MGISPARALGSLYGSRGATWEGVLSRVMDNEEATADSSARQLDSEVLADLSANQSVSDLWIVLHHNSLGLAEELLLLLLLLFLSNMCNDLAQDHATVTAKRSKFSHPENSFRTQYKHYVSLEY